VAFVAVAIALGSAAGTSTISDAATRRRLKDGRTAVVQLEVKGTNDGATWKVHGPSATTTACF
jgi:hypothetical protein